MTDETPSQGLLACPFCGGEAMLIERDTWWAVNCLPCTAEVEGADATKAIAAWNTRALIASTPEPDMLLRKLRDLFDDKGYLFCSGDYQIEVIAEVDATIAALDAACPRHE